ncbi:ABC transporter, ATP-binding protein domain containing protein [Theileria equi strain WA]|uniref:ABC transporter, ATP-binding protein domain containing protein n=1 Tax=Theileria equi strain WA TaxID=1537102 RepID=L1LCI8_THEEQ|nr:ABC transporter, ATP-binding protein domain containing protein [Theileria equi strain WA]EKX72994.1 ABC transporter, ATP-binding protein domain containing protein [Theileria equi strain WA]|eukprot:XP_004832446.1 ABC transporter, ATP-binding protein domain containing protein [Theileria equi strain WA]
MVGSVPLPGIGSHHFWESEVEVLRKRAMTHDGKKFRYFDDKGIFNFVFLAWMYRWVKETSKRYMDPYMLHPLPLADQILLWQPILSKHISDGIASLEAYETLSEDEKKKAKKPVRYLLFRAIWLTFWKRLLTIFLGIVVMNAIGMSVAVFLHKLLGLLSDKEFKFVTLLSLAVFTIVIELVKMIGMSHINYYVERLAILLDASLRVTIFQHGLCYRRTQFENLKPKGSRCNSVIHSCSGDSPCSSDPLLCPARRYKNNEVTPKMYALILTDSYYLPFFIEAVPGFVDFLTSLTYGIILMSSQFNIKALTVLIVSLSLVVCMFIVEILNGCLFKWYLGTRDHRISKSSEVITGLHLIERMALDDIGHDIITETRNDELKIVFVRFFLSLVNKVLMTSIMCINIIILVNDFVGQVREVTDLRGVNPSGLLASIFVIMKIIGPLYMVPMYLRLMLFGINAFKRVEAFLRTCSPNFYLPDNRFTGRNPLPEALPDEDKTLPKGLVVMLKKASFAWVNSRKDLLDNTGTTCLRNLDFVLNTGDLAIITGAQGSGKTNFVKAILGDMTLVEGSMAVLPLSTNMPIFYASQDVWLQKGTIRANITFGHRFDEKLYNTVLKAIELEHDISTWEGGDMRKISEHGYSLSGGQRVRVGLARAIYAYLIFNKANREDSNAKCSFLVVLDDSFTGLDPFVAKTIFKNLFEKGRGLLSGGDVATVLTISKRILEACVSSESPESFLDAPIYTLRSEALVQDNRLRSFMKNKTEDVRYPVTSIDKMELQSVPFDVLRRCSSDDYTRFGRKRSTEFRYSDSPTVQHLYDKNKTKNYKSDIIRQFKVYFSAASWPVFLFLFLTLIFATLDSTKFIITSKVSDSIVDYTKKHEGTEVSLEDVKEYCYKSLRWILVLSASVMIGAVIRIVAMTKASFNVSRRIHEYCINSVFTNSSVVLKIKKSMSSVQTFLYMDTLSIDNMLSYYLHDVFVLLIEMGVQMLTLFFMMPWSAPIAIGLCLLILRFLVYYYIKACKNIAFSRLEAYNQIDSTIESAISGLSVCRSFKSEWKLVHIMAEHVDYNVRGTYMNNSAMFWSSIASRCLLSPLALFILLFPIVRSRFCDMDIKVGYYGMAYSLFLNVNNYFANFLEISYFLQLHVLPMRRFENFIPKNTPLKFVKKKDINRTDIVVDSGSSTGDKISDENIKDSIRKRRRNEYAERRAARCTNLKMLLFKHHVNILDISKYAVPGHVRVQLKDVNVYITSCKDGIQFPILKNVTCSADTSDIVGIVGRTGAGKSTMLSVLQNLAEHREGSVLLDGCDLNDMPKDVTRQIIGVLPQLPFVFRGWTVRRFIDPRMLFDDTNIEMALDNCGLLKFVMNLPGGEGLDTIIIPEHYHKDLPRHYKRVYYGPTLRPYDSPSADNVNIDYGSALSNSQLRTLSVARLVLYREFFKVLLVDEPPEDELGAYNTAETPIYELIKTHFQHCTTFIAAHDAGVLRLCTSVWVFHKGSLIRTCKTEDIVDTGSLSKIIEDCITTHI